jgi:hypothetical protein
MATAVGEAANAQYAPPPPAYGPSPTYTPRALPERGDRLDSEQRALHDSPPFEEQHAEKADRVSARPAGIRGPTGRDLPRPAGRPVMAN